MQQRKEGDVYWGDSPADCDVETEFCCLADGSQYVFPGRVGGVRVRV